MTKIQRAYSFFFSLCLAGTLLFLPGQFFLPLLIRENSGTGFFLFSQNVYMRLPLYSYLEEQVTVIPKTTDEETSDLIMEANRKTILQEWQTPGDDVGAEGDVLTGRDTQAVENLPSGEGVQEVQEISAEKNVPSGEDMQEAQVVSTGEEVPTEKAAQNPDPLSDDFSIEALAPDPKAALSQAKLNNFDYLINQFYIIDENTAANAEQINAIRFLAQDLSLKKDASKPQILIYHSHSQETFADSREGHPEDTVVGVGDYLTKLLTERYGYQVLHVTEAFDLIDGVLDRSKAYDVAREYITKVLEENPSIEVVIDLHRDGVPENRHLVTNINGKETAQILFFNGLSYTQSQGALSYLPNPYIQQNLAFSFQLEYLASQYFPDFPRGIYLAGLRYNLHLRPRALLLEAGAQTNTVQEVKNAMEPFAAVLDMVLAGKD